MVEVISEEEAREKYIHYINEMVKANMEPEDSAFFLANLAMLPDCDTKELAEIYNDFKKELNNGN